MINEDIQCNLNCKKWLGNKFINNECIHVCINLKHIRFVDSKEGSRIMAESRFSFVREKDVEIVRENSTPLNTQKHTMWNNVCCCVQ